MIRVLLLCRYDRKGGSSRLRFLQYIPHLKARGISLTPAPFFDDVYLSRLYAGHWPRLDHLVQYYVRRLRNLLCLDRYDLIWLEKEALPWLPVWLEHPWLQRLPYVLDVDDAWFHRYGSHRLSVVRQILGSKLDALAQRAAAVVVGNDYLEDWARRSGAQRVVQLPTVVDLDRYPYTPAPQQKHFTIGWIGVPSTAIYLGGIADALREVCAQPATRLRLVGAHSKVDLSDVPLEWRSWAEDREFEDIASFDVGIAPLRDGPWERGKCACKIIQYMAAARPVVASPVGANAKVVRDGETGFLVETKREWVDALTRLRADHALRSRMGQAGRVCVEDQYSLSANVDRLSDTLRVACGAARIASVARQVSGINEKPDGVIRGTAAGQAAMGEGHIIPVRDSRWRGRV